MQSESKGNGANLQVLQSHFGPCNVRYFLLGMEEGKFAGKIKKISNAFCLPPHLAPNNCSKGRFIPPIIKKATTKLVIPKTSTQVSSEAIHQSTMFLINDKNYTTTSFKLYILRTFIYICDFMVLIRQNLIYFVELIKNFFLSCILLHNSLTANTK